MDKVCIARGAIVFSSDEEEGRQHKHVERGGIGVAPHLPVETDALVDCMFVAMRGRGMDVHRRPTRMDGFH